MFTLEDLRIPMLAAPMAGGPSTPELVVAMAEAGAAGFLAGAGKTPDEIALQVAEVRAGSDAPFGVNLFVPADEPDVSAEAREAVRVYRERLLPEAERYGIELPEANLADDGGWSGQVAQLLADPVPFVSFIFGCPDAALIGRFRDAGSFVIVTVTDAVEARRSHERGADALVVQGPDAGGHRGTHEVTKTPGTMPLPDLLAEVRGVTDLPLVAAGGVMTGADIRAALDVGATAVQMGTAFLRAPECGASALHKDALASGEMTRTRVTRAFSGRLAQGLENRFIRDHDDAAPAVFPALNQLTRPLRSAAGEAGDPDGMSLWAGTGFAKAMDRPAGEIVASIWRDAGV